MRTSSVYVIPEYDHNVMQRYRKVQSARVIAKKYVHCTVSDVEAIRLSKETMSIDSRSERERERERETESPKDPRNVATGSFAYPLRFFIEKISINARRMTHVSDTRVTLGANIDTATLHVRSICVISIRQ
jgi:hypothetical protein